MHPSQLLNKKIAIISTLGFEKVELVAIRDALKAGEATVHIIAPQEDTIRAFEFPDWSDSVDVDYTLGQVSPDDYDGLYIPGGIINPDLLRLDVRAIEFVRHFVATEKPIASMCHGPWVLISAGGVKGRKMAAWPSLRDDLTNAGATWVDAPVVKDSNIVTARNPDDIPEFVSALTTHFS